MTEREQQRLVNHRLAVIRDAEEVTGNVAQTCRYFGNTRQTFWSTGPVAITGADGHAAEFCSVDSPSLPIAFDAWFETRTRLRRWTTPNRQSTSPAPSNRDGRIPLGQPTWKRSSVS